jgi:multicomponent Na+:H+ antiporter subunit F
MESVLTAVLYLSLGIHIAMMGAACWRVWRGENVIDRLMASDLLTTLTLATLVLVSLIVQRIIYIDVALGLAALSFVGTIALAKYLADEQMF